ncbi:TPA: lipopolysaccharide biosynthesis protein [Photobacterium damselae]
MEKELIKNIISSYSTHAIRIILPLLLVGVMGHYFSSEEFGLYIYYISLSFLYSQLVEYGFSIISSRDISSGKDVSKIIVKTESARIIIALTIISLVIIYFVFFEWNIFLFISLFSGVFLGLSPLYYFQGSLNYKKIFKIELIFSVFYYVLSTLFVVFFKSALLVLISYMIYRLLILICYRCYLPKYQFSLKCGLLFIVKSWYMFVYRLSVYGYTSFNNLILNFMLGVSFVASFAPTDKITTGTTGLIMPINQVLMTHLCTDRKSIDKRKIIVIGFVITLSLSIIISIFSINIIQLIFGDNYKNTSIYLSILIFIFPVKYLSSCIGNLYLIPDGREKKLSQGVVISSLIHVPVSFALTYYYSLYGLVCSILITELSVLLWFVFFVLRGKYAFNRNLHI